MDYTSAPGNVGGLYVDDDPGVPIVGTLLNAADRNALQAEILNVIINAGLTPSAANLSQLWEALTKGALSLIDSDKLDGQDGSYYQNAGNLNAGTLDPARTPAYIGDVTKTEGSNSLTLAASKVLEKLVTVDGIGSDLDADKYRGGEIKELFIDTVYNSSPYIFPAMNVGDRINFFIRITGVTMPRTILFPAEGTFFSRWSAINEGTAEFDPPLAGFDDADGSIAFTSMNSPAISLSGFIVRKS